MQIKSWVVALRSSDPFIRVQVSDVNGTRAITISKPILVLHRPMQICYTLALSVSSDSIIEKLLLSPETTSPGRFRVPGP